MPRTIEEENLRFVFDDSWSVIKYDDHPDYQDKIKKFVWTGKKVGEAFQPDMS